MSVLDLLPNTIRIPIVAFRAAWKHERDTLRAGGKPNFWLPFFPYRKYLSEREYVAHVEEFSRRRKR